MGLEFSLMNYVCNGDEKFGILGKNHFKEICSMAMKFSFGSSCSMATKLSSSILLTWMLTEFDDNMPEYWIEFKTIKRFTYLSSCMAWIPDPLFVRWHNKTLKASLFNFVKWLHVICSRTCTLLIHGNAKFLEIVLGCRVK